MNTHYKIGFRAIKSSIAVAVCILLSCIFKQLDPIYSCIAAIICMRQTYDETFESGVRRIVGTLLGGFMGYIVLLGYRMANVSIDYVNALVVPVSMLVVIYLCNFIGKKGAVEIGCIVLLSVVLDIGVVDDSLMYVFYRIVNTIIGIVIAMVVNRYLFPNNIKS